MDKTSDQLIIEYAPLVRRIARHMMSRLPASVEVDDLIQAGMIGLLDAIRLHGELPGQSFQNYAFTRIRGAMLDALRRADCIGRPHREKIKRGESEEVIISSFEDALEEGFDLISQEDTPLEYLIKKDLVMKAVGFFDGLSEKHKKLMTMRYVDGVSLRGIGRIMGKSEAWACIQHKEILNQLEGVLN
jgi:RNA polymerase sigma factor for flagellar operon FliA